MWRYSGGGYQILQQLLEDVTGRVFADLAAELVLRPAGMTTATYAQPDPANAAAPHIARCCLLHHPSGRPILKPRKIVVKGALPASLLDPSATAKEHHADRESRSAR